MSGVKSQEEFIEPPQNELPIFEDVKDISRNTEAPNIEPQNRESFITEKNFNLPTTSNIETQNNEQSTATSTNIQNIDDSQKVTTTETTSTVALTEPPRTENIMELSNLEVSNTQTSNTESSNMGSSNIENKQNFQNSEASSTLPQNSSLSNKESFISETTNQQIKDIERNTNQTVNDKNNENPVLTQTNVRNNTKSIERPNIVFIVADDLVKQLFIYYIHAIKS